MVQLALCSEFHKAKVKMEARLHSFKVQWKGHFQISQVGRIEVHGTVELRSLSPYWPLAGDQSQFLETVCIP